MQNSKTIFVTGATGNQGGAVARSLSNNGFKVKALTRNPSSLAAQNLKKLPVEIVHGDLNNTGTYREYIKDVDGIFGVLTNENGIDKEIKQGIDLANLAKEHGVKHFVYSSVTGADQHTGIPHWESKFRIENHIRQINLPHTIVRPASLFENFLIPQVKSRILKGKLASPVNKDVIQQFISSKDVGEISAGIFMKPEKYLGETLTIAAEEMDMNEVAHIFSEALGKEIKYQKLPGLITRLVMGKDLYKMFTWVNENDAVFLKDLDAFRKEYPGLTGLKEWIQLNFKTT
ncbi:MAG: NmrA/HSCARG family protein [Ginsengibacter sp.]